MANDEFFLKIKPKSEFPVEITQKDEFPVEIKQKVEFPVETNPKAEFPVETKPKVAQRSPPALSCLCKICGAPAPNHFHFGGEISSFSMEVSFSHFLILEVSFSHFQKLTFAKCSGQCCFSCRAFFRRSTQRKKLRGWLRFRFYWSLLLSFPKISIF